MFILRHDVSGRFSYAPLQSLLGKMLLRDFETPDSVVLYENGAILTETRAVFQILKYLDTKWRFLRVFRFLPLKVTDAVYRIVARNRKRWFGYAETCMLPSESDKEKVERYNIASIPVK